MSFSVLCSECIYTNAKPKGEGDERPAKRQRVNVQPKMGRSPCFSGDQLLVANVQTVFLWYFEAEACQRLSWHRSAQTVLDEPASFA